MHPYRSILFVPAHKPAWAEKALAAGREDLANGYTEWMRLIGEGKRKIQPKTGRG